MAKKVAKMAKKRTTMGKNTPKMYVLITCVVPLSLCKDSWLEYTKDQKVSKMAENSQKVAKMTQKDKNGKKNPRNACTNYL